MKLKEWAFGVFVVGILVSGITSCKSSPTSKKEKDKTEAANRALDEEFEIKRQKRHSKVKVNIEKGGEIAKQIDGDPSDWKTPSFRTFQSPADIKSGNELWEGPDDLSVKVALDSDKGWVYFLVDVKDDRVLPGIDGKLSDGVRITVYDPGLDLLDEKLPFKFAAFKKANFRREFTVLADGRVLDADGENFDLVESAIDERADGYVAEIAFPIEALSVLSSLPLQELAFRIEILDGDDKKYQGVQTILDTIQRRGGGRKKFARVDVNLFPHAQTQNVVPRRDALGIWILSSSKRWTFESYEVLPKLWAPLEQKEKFEAELRESDGISEVCNLARNDFFVVDAYQSTGGGFQAALLVCGSRSSKKTCSKHAKSNAYWIRAEKTSGAWQIDRKIKVFDQDVSECIDNIKGKKGYYTQFTLFPLDILGKAFWMVGWSTKHNRKELRQEKSGIVFLNSKSEDRAIIGKIDTDERTADYRTRTVSKTTTFLARLNKDKFVDICQREAWFEQECDGFQKGCDEVDTKVNFHMFMWEPKQQFFDTYGLISQKKCNQNFDLKEVKSYMILQMEDRLSLIPFPKQED